MNAIIKEAMLLVVATLVTLSVSAQTEELWIDKYETEYVVDTMAADSIEMAMNAVYNARRREQEEREKVAPIRKEIAMIDELIVAEKEERRILPVSVGNQELFNELIRLAGGYENMKWKEINALSEYRVPKGFTKKYFLPAKNELQAKLDAFVPEPDETKYNWRNDHNTSSIPKKAVQVRKRVLNPECRDNYFNGNIANGSNEYALYHWDDAQQSTGWEWVNKEEMEYKEVFYPEHLEYYAHSSHPEYRFDGSKKNQQISRESGLFAYDEIGKLIRADNVLGDKIPYHLKDDVMKAICKCDFLANKYDINKAEKKTLVALRIRFGITKGVDERFEKYKNLCVASSYSMMTATTFEEYRSALAIHNEAMKVMREYAFMELDEQADNYIKQLEKDHAEDLKYLYKIERIDNTTFKIFYLNDKLECGCIALMKWFSSKPYECEYEIELLPCETIMIRK